MTFPICPCDGDRHPPPTNLPQLSHISYRVGTYADFRRAVLTPLAGEQSLVGQWRAGLAHRRAGDLAVMIAEWFAYIADILTFYNERIANQDYLRTADLPESVKRLIALLGYRPRPAIGATGMLAALVTAGQSALLPQGLQFQSKPTPGQAPQIFELVRRHADRPARSDSRDPAAGLLSPIADFRFMYLSVGLNSPRPRGKRTARLFQLHADSPIRRFQRIVGQLQPAAARRGHDVDPGAMLLLRPRDPAAGRSAAGGRNPARPSNPRPPAASRPRWRSHLRHAARRVDRGAGAAGAQQPDASACGASTTAAIGGRYVHLASLVRQIRPGAWVLFTAPGFTRRCCAR